MPQPASCSVRPPIRSRGSRSEHGSSVRHSVRWKRSSPRRASPGARWKCWHHSPVVAARCASRDAVPVRRIDSSARARPRSERPRDEAAKTALPLAEFIERTPDGVVVTDSNGVVLSANPAFLELAQLADEEQARGRSLGEWVGRPGGDLSMIIGIVRKHGVGGRSSPLCATSMVSRSRSNFPPRPSRTASASASDSPCAASSGA